MAYKPKWIDFANENPPLGPILPLTSGQMVLPVSGLLPSGESGGFDNSQYHSVRSETAGIFIGSGINVPYPYPNYSTAREYAYVSGDNTTAKFTDIWWETSGILKTYPSNDGLLYGGKEQSGILHYTTGVKKGILISSGMFSTGENARSNQIEDFTIFNDYIHHQKLPSTSTKGNLIKIPYVSTFKKAFIWNPYG